ncbi:hypothetical protein F3Y22_tig00110206pilonHSYRG00479 [Hibiscus syriacus]|uniref:RING-type domain-containing protein n=1 Tax=Hibiscus syriacus TaxID=106335 RepID=A0A6A3BFG2_HIBSY|nr:BOI-related E3 ubiquitin-protein ligase 1-like [Hibiscus syriacus]KAE8713782.1 hypothetical protein F3Y22_tig00110206pilonHSYRG00479 [Hibiscus syriacus]
MAVQAQYPSNILLLNRGGQEEHEFSLQQQTGGVFIDQSHMFSNNNNTRKRGREVAIITPINSFSLQTQPSQLIDLSQLHQPNAVSTGLRLSSGDQQQNLQQTQNHCYPQQQQLSLLSNSFDDLGTQIQRQREELDQFLQAQGEELRRVLVEKRQRNYRALLGAAEESVERRLREKEAEVEKAKRRNAELEARAAQVRVETQVWQAKAMAQEATSVSLQAQLQKAIMSGGAAVTHDGKRGNDGLNCAGGMQRQAEDAESAYVDPDRVVLTGPACKACGTCVASVVVLPCGHLCLCTECDRVAEACPLCLTVRNSSVEVLLFP